MTNRRVLVTGAAGFIGAHLCRRLHHLGNEVHGVSRAEVHDKTYRWWKADLADVEASRRIVGAVKPDILYHLASEVTGVRDAAAVMPTLQSNLMTTVNLLLAAREVDCERILITGSLEETDPGTGASIPSSPYAAAKSAATSYARMFHALYGVPVVLLRLFMVYGPAQRDGRKLIPYVIASLLRGESPKLSSGQRDVDWIYVEDVVDALVAAAQASNVEGKTIDAGSGTLTPVKTVVEKLAALIRPALDLQFGGLPDRPMERVCSADVEGAYAMTGWKPATSLDDGLAATVGWYERRVEKGDG